MSIDAIDFPAISGLILIISGGVLGGLLIVAQTVAKRLGRRPPGLMWWMAPVGVSAVACYSIVQVVHGAIDEIDKLMESMGDAGRVPRDAVMAISELGTSVGVANTILGVGMATGIALSISGRNTEKSCPVERLSAGL